MNNDRIRHSISRLSTPQTQVLDVVEAANLLGTTPKAVRQRVAWRTLPFQKLGGRIIFFKNELEEFLRDLPGCSVEEAKINTMARGGDLCTSVVMVDQQTPISSAPGISKRQGLPCWPVEERRGQALR